MKKISNFGDKELRKEQFQVLLDVLASMKSKADLKLFVKSFLTESEAAYLSQRLNIMRMLAKNFTYQQIIEKLGVPSNTISKAKLCLDQGEEALKKIVLEYKYKSARPKSGRYIDDDPRFRAPRMPGAIKF